MEILPLTPAGPAVQYWGWDLKGGTGGLTSAGGAQLAYGDGPANIVRFPIFGQSISSTGSVDGSMYTTRLQALSEILRVDPNVKIYASLKLDGANTFPSWVDSTDHTGKIFGSTVYRPDPVKFAGLLTTFVQYMADQGYAVSYLGPGNETGQALGTTRFGQTVQNLKSNLAARNLPIPTIVGPDSYSLTADGTFDHASDFLEDGTSRNVIDIVGSHFYVGDESATNWRTLSTLSGGKPMWHTEVHIDTAAGDLQQVYRDSLALAFKSNRNGVTGMVHWGSGTDTGSITQTLRREMVRTMLGSTPSNMSNSYSIDDPDGTPLYQGYYNEAAGKLYLWVANPGTWLPNTSIELNGLAFNGSVTGTWWQGDSETITAANTGSQSGSIAPDGRSFTSTFKSNAVTLVTIPVTPLSSTFTWDADLGAFAAQDGAGTWSAGGSNWWRGVQSAWSDGAGVVFGAAGGTGPHTVTLGSHLAVGNVTFAVPGYTIAADAGRQYAVTLQGTPTVTTNADAVIHAPLAGGGLVKAGPGTLTLGGPNTYTGTTTVAAGTLRLAGGMALGAGGFDSVTLTNVRSGAAVEIQGGLVINEHTHVAGPGIGGAGVLRALGDGSSINQPLAFDADSTIHVPAGASLAVHQLYTDVGVRAGMVKTGAGQLVMCWPSVYSGDTVIAAGSVKLARSGAEVSVVNAGFELPAFGPGGWNYLGGDGQPGGWAIRDGGVARNGSPWVSAAPEGVQVGFLQQSSAYAGQTVTVAEAGTYSIAFQAANRPGYNANGLILQVDGTEVARWAYADFNTGGTFVDKSATVTLAAGSHAIAFAAWNGAGGDVATAIDNVRVASVGEGLLPSGTGVYLASGALLDLNGHSQTVASLSDYGGGGGRIANSAPGGATLTVSAPAGTTATFGGAIESGAGGVGLTKAGPGTQVLTGANRYTGATTILAGRLLVNGSLDAGSAVTVGGEGVLGGSGAVGGAVSVYGRLAPGASIESLSTGALAFNAGSTFQYEMNTSDLDGDLVLVNGDLSLNGIVTLDLVELVAGSLPPGRKLTLINYGGAWNGGIFEGYRDDSVFTLGANRWRIDYDAAAGGSNFSAEQTLGQFVTLTVASDLAPIPEPCTVLLLGPGVLGLANYLRNRRRSAAALWQDPT